MLTLLRGFMQQHRGMAAVEFALIAPILILLFFGTIEACNALICHQKVTQVASAAADLVAQATQVSSADLEDVFAAASEIMTPFPSVETSIVITSIAGTGVSDKGRVVWSQSNTHGVARMTNDIIDVPQDLLPTTCTSVSICTLVLAEVVYKYNSPFGKIVVGTVNMNDLFYAKPRRTIAVTRL